MPVDVTFTVSPDIAEVAAKLKALDSTNGGRLRKDLAAAMRVIGRDFVKAEQAAIRGTKIKGVKKGGGLRHKRGDKPLPKGSGHGIRNSIARAVKTRNRLTNTKTSVAGIEIRVSRSAMPPGMEGIPSDAQRGRIRHPLFGDRSQWYSQQVMPAAWWSKTGNEQLAKAQAELIQVVNNFDALA